MKLKPRQFSSKVNIRYADAKHPPSLPVRNLVEQSTVGDADSSVKGIGEESCLRKEIGEEEGGGRETLPFAMYALSTWKEYKNVIKESVFRYMSGRMFGQITIHMLLPLYQIHFLDSRSHHARKSESGKGLAREVEPFL